MTPTETGKGYDTIATRWVSEEFPDANGIQQHERAIAFVQETHFALDVGCGANTRLIDLFEQHGFRVDGVDVSREMIQLAKLRKPEVQYYLADVCTWELPRRYDLISAWDSIWHVPLGEQERVLRKLIHGLTPCGILIFSTGALESPSEHVDDTMGPNMYYSSLGVPRTLAVLQESGAVCRHLEQDGPESHLYVIAQRGR